jgi:hypothetical protein
MAFSLGRPGSGETRVSAHPEFGELNNATLAALLFELASQLHIERTQRLALQAALTSKGIITSVAIEAVDADAAFREELGNAADQSVSKLLRVLSESPDERVPLRSQASHVSNGEN